MSGVCNPNLPSLGLRFTSVTGLPADTPVVELNVPVQVKGVLRAVCETSISAAVKTGRAAADAAEPAASRVGEEGRKIIKTLGAVRELKYEDIPEDYRAAFLGFLAGQPSNAYGGGLPNQPQTAGGYTLGWLASQGTQAVAGWIGFEGDVGMVIWLGPDQKWAGVAGTLNWTLPVKSKQ